MEGDEICGKRRKVLLSAMSDERASWRGSRAQQPPRAHDLGRRADIA